MTACDQKVYEPAKSAPVKTPAESDPVRSAASQVRNPHASAAQMAEARFMPNAGSPPASHTTRFPIAKYRGYPWRGVTSIAPPASWKAAVSPKSSEGSSVARYSANAPAATTAAAISRCRAIPRSTRSASTRSAGLTLRGKPGAQSFERKRVDDVAGLDPSPPCSADGEQHVAAEEVRAVTVTVD